jgi:hypothetical protein
MTDWIEWSGGERPVDASAIVDVSFGIGKPFATGLASWWDWRATDQIKWWRPTARETTSTPQEAAKAAWDVLVQHHARLQCERDTKLAEVPAIMAEVRRLDKQLAILADHFNALRGIFDEQ